MMSDSNYGHLAQMQAPGRAASTLSPPDRGVAMIEQQVKGACQHAATIEDRLNKLAMRIVGPSCDPAAIGECAERPIEPYLQDQLGDLINTLNRVSATLDHLDA